MPQPQQRPLSEQAFNAVKAKVLASAPDGMSEAQFNAWVGEALPKALAEAEGVGFQPANQTTVVNGQEFTDPNTVGTLASHVVQQVNPIPGITQAFRHPIDTAKQIGQAQAALYDKAKAAYDKGDYGNAAIHFVNYMIPLLGPGLDKAGESFQQGKYMAGAGDSIGLGLALFGPKAIANSAARVPVVPKVKGTNPVESAAIQEGMAQGVPVDVATATGNRFVRGVQKLADESLGGSGIASKANARTTRAMTNWGNREAANTGGAAVTPEQAGANTAGSLTGKIKTQALDEAAAYRAVEVAAKAKNVTVDIKPVQAALKPLYQSLQREATLAPLMGGKAEALRALDRLMTPQKPVPLMEAESALSDLKAMARPKAGQSTLKELRTQGQGAVAFSIKNLQASIDGAAGQAGVIGDLRKGRAFTASKWATADTLDKLRAEPVQAFRQMTAPKDSGIQLLRRIVKETPGAAKETARAYIEQLMGRATEAGGFGHADALYSEWQKLGPETKKILFPNAGQVQTLDRFFLLAKRLAENPNPSGTALTAWKGGELSLLFTHPTLGVPYSFGAAAVSKLLHSPAAARVLTRGLSVSLSGASKPAQAAAIGDLLRAAREAGVSPVAVTAEGDQRAAK